MLVAGIIWLCSMKSLVRDTAIVAEQENNALAETEPAPAH